MKALRRTPSHRAAKPITISPEVEQAYLKIAPFFDGMDRFLVKGQDIIRLNDQGIEMMRSQGFPNWHNFYKEDQAEEYQKSVLSPFKIENPFLNANNKDNVSAEDIAKVMEQVKTIEQKDIDPEFLKRLEENPASFATDFFLTIVAFINNGMCGLLYKKSLAELIGLAKKGDLKSFIEILKIDKTFIFADWAQRLIQEAQLKDDAKFFKVIGRALSNKIGVIRKQHFKTLMVGYFLWNQGFSKMRWDERLAFLLKHNLYSGNVTTLTRLFNRYGLRNSQKVPV